MKNLNNVHIENDKILCPFLLAASFNGLIKFEGSHVQSSILYWYFSPEDQTRKLIDRFVTKTEPHIPAKDLFEAIEAFWTKISQLKNGDFRNEKS